MINCNGFDIILLMSTRFQEKRIGGGTTSVADKEQTSQSVTVAVR